jgi:hypothetical protein
LRQVHKSNTLKKEKVKHDLDTIIDAIKGTGAYVNKDGTTNTSGGNISVVARRLGVARKTVYSYLNRWKTVEEAFFDEKEAMLDFTENKLFQQVAEGNITAIIFTLKTIGKSRGYVERAEVTNDGKMEIIVKYADRKRNDTDTP